MSTNLFALLDVSDDEEQPKTVDKKAPAAKKDTGVKKDAATKPAAKAPEAKKDAAPAKDNKPKPASDKTSKSASDKPKPIVDKSAKPAATAAEGEDAPSGKDNIRGGQARHKDHGGRGGRGGHGVPESVEGQTRVKREFDRRSGSGRGREVSKGGRGAFGFGNPAQDAQDAEKDPNAAEAILEPVDGAAEDAEPEVVAEPEPATFTLDQYLEKRNEARKALLSQETKVRAVDTKALAGLSKKEDETDLLYMADKVKAAKAEAAKKDQRSTAKNQVLDVAFKFAEVQVDDDRNDRRGGRGGGRGRGDGGRGDGGRGGGRGRGRSSGASHATGSNSKPTTVFNSLDFPSL